MPPSNLKPLPLPQQPDQPKGVYVATLQLFVAANSEDEASDGIAALLEEHADPDFIADWAYLRVGEQYLWPAPLHVRADEFITARERYEQRREIDAEWDGEIEDHLSESAEPAALPDPWIKISDQLPPVGVEVQLYGPGIFGYRALGHLMADTGIGTVYSASGSFMYEGSVTHWQPLDPAPQS